MKITSIKSHVLRYELEKELGYSQQYYKHRTAHLVEVETDEGITGWGECFGPGNIALANKFIVEKGYTAFSNWWRPFKQRTYLAKSIQSFKR